MTEEALGTGRRTQAERSAAMQERIIAATVQCLIEFGYSGTTTSTIERQAGVSRGALQHHYPSKSDLLVATAQHLANVWMSELAQVLVEHTSVDDVVADLWRQFDNPRYDAILELRVAARTDPTLHEALLAPQGQMCEELFVALCRHYGRSDSDTAFRVAVEMMWHFLSGLRVSALVGPDAETEHRVLGWLKHLVSPLLEWQDDSTAGTWFDAELRPVARI